MKFGKKMKEQHQFSNFKMAAVAMLDSDQQAYFERTCVAIQSRNISIKFVENWLKNLRTASVSAKRTQRSSHFYR